MASERHERIYATHLFFGDMSDLDSVVNVLHMKMEVAMDFLDEHLEGEYVFVARKGDRRVCFKYKGRVLEVQHEGRAFHIVDVTGEND